MRVRGISLALLISMTSIAAAQSAGSFDVTGFGRYTRFDDPLRIQEQAGGGGSLTFFPLANVAIEGEGAWYRVIEFGAALRWRLFGLAYGDQGLLVRRSLYEAAGGYPELGIMEDVVMIRRLGRLARIVRFRTPLLTDARRWAREGPVRASLRNVALLSLYLAGAAPDRLARWYTPEPRDR